MWSTLNLVLAPLAVLGVVDAVPSDAVWVHTTANRSFPLCGPATTLQPYPGPNQDHGYPGAQLGPVWYVYAQGTTTASFPDFSPGSPTKYAMEAAVNVDSPVTLQGTDCKRGRDLHFCYYPGCQHAVVPDDDHDYTRRQLQHMGDDPAVLPVGPAGSQYVGDLLFWKPGLYRLTAFMNGQVVGTIVANVPSPHH